MGSIIFYITQPTKVVQYQKNRHPNSLKNGWIHAFGGEEKETPEDLLQFHHGATFCASAGAIFFRKKVSKSGI